MAEPLKVKLKKAPSNLTMNVKIIKTPEFKFRLWLGLKLIKLGASIIGFGVKVEDV